MQPLPSDTIKTSMFGCLNAKFHKTKNKPTETTFVAQRFLGHNCLGLHRCVRGQRVMLPHSMEISESLTKLFC